MRIRKSFFAGVLAGACALGFGAAQLSGPGSGNAAASLHRASAAQSATSKHALLTALFTRTDSTAGDPIFMQVPGVAGGSADRPGWIDVLAWAVGFENPNALSSQTGGNPSVSTFTATIDYSQASPQLLQALATGEHLGTIEVDFVKAGPAPALTYLKIVLTNAAIVSISDTGSVSENVPTENVAIKASQLSATYTPQNADGSAGTPVSFCYNFAQKKAC